MFLLNAFAWASRPAWSAHEIVSTTRACAISASGEALSVLTGVNQAVVEQFVTDGIAWLVARGLLGPKAEAQYGPYFMLTSEGLEAAKRGSVTHIEATLHLHSELHPVLSASARPNFERGDYATAVFAAMHEVEVAVRDAGEFGPDNFGVPLMRLAFNPGGPLANANEVKGEQEAMSNLVAGAIGAFKNPTSHRTVEYDSPIEAASIIHLADLLLRIVDRAKARRDAEAPDE